MEMGIISVQNITPCRHTFEMNKMTLCLSCLCLYAMWQNTRDVVLLILRLREQLRSIVMSTSVCLSVHEDISGTRRAIFTNFFVHGLVLLRYVYDRPHHLSVGRGGRECIAWTKYNL